jgi:hypothetical protein
MYNGGADLNIGDMPLRSQIHPVSFIKFRSDHVIEVRNFVVLTDQCS